MQNVSCRKPGRGTHQRRQQVAGFYKQLPERREQENKEKDIGHGGGQTARSHSM